MKEHSTYPDFHDAVDATTRSIPHGRHLPHLSRAVKINIATYMFAHLTELLAQDEPIATGTQNPYNVAVYFDAGTGLTYWILENGDGATVYTTDGVHTWRSPSIQPYLLSMLYCVDSKLDINTTTHFPGIIDSDTRGVFEEIADCYLSDLDRGEYALRDLNAFLVLAINEARRYVTFLAMIRGKWITEQRKTWGNNGLARELGITPPQVSTAASAYARHWRTFEDAFRPSS